MNDNSEMEREAWVDFVRVTAIFLVVLLHSAAPWLYQYGQAPNFDWQFGNVIDSVTRISVPLFFMITGYLLLNNPISLKTYLNKRLSRILIPWLAWSFIYYLYKNIRMDAPITLNGALLEFVNGDIYFHLWFMYALVGLYLFVPVISWFLAADQQKRGVYFLFLWIFTACLLPLLATITKYTSSYEINFGVDLSMFSGLSGYLIAGTLIGKSKPSTLQLALISCAYIFGLIITIVGTSLGSYHLGRFTGYFYEYTSPNVVLASFAAFALLKRIGETIKENKKLSIMFARVGYTSLGIYLIHPIILNAINDGFLGSRLAFTIQNSALTIPLVAILTFLISYFAIELISFIPGIRKIA